MRIIAKITQILHSFGTIIIIIMALLITLQIIFRILGVGIGGVEELTGYMVLWLCFLELPNITKREHNVRVDLVISHLGPAAQRALKVITNIVAILILLFITYKGLQIVRLSYEVNRMTAYLKIPLFLLQGILPLGMTVTALELLFGTGRIFRGKELSPAEDGASMHLD